MKINFGIKNVIPLWVITLWLTVGTVMFMASIGWNLLELECLEQIPCFIFSIFMTLLHYLGIGVLVLGVFVLIGNEKQALN